MSVKRIVFLRHGQTDANLNQRIQGAIDVPLNATGRAQAAAAAKEVALLEPSRIFTSDLSRARETAAQVAKLTGVSVVADSRLRERNYGPWEGLTAAEIVERWPEEWETWRVGDEPGLGIETRQACGERLAACVEDAVKSSPEGEEETLLFVAHGGAISCALGVLLGENSSLWAGFRVLDNCHWAMLIPKPQANPKWRVVVYNRVEAVTTDFDYTWDK